MNSGRLALAVTKAITCIVGFGIAGMLIWSLGPHPDNELNVLWGLGGALIGLCFGTCWASDRIEMRIAFIMPLLVGLLAFWAVMSSHGASPYCWQPWNMPLLLLLVLVIGSVWALSRAGVFKAKRNQETALEDSSVDVIEQIRKLAELKSEGILTDEEFESKKQELLAKL